MQAHTYFFVSAALSLSFAHAALALDEFDPMSPGTVQKKLPRFEVKPEVAESTHEDGEQEDESISGTQEVSLPHSEPKASNHSQKNARASSHQAMRKEAKSSRSYLAPWQINAGVSLSYDDFAGNLGVSYPLHRYLQGRGFYQHRSSVRDYGRVTRHGGFAGVRLALVNPTIFVPIADANTGYETWRYTVDGEPHHSGGSPVTELGAGLTIRLTPYFAITGYRRSLAYWEGNPGADTEKGDWDRKNTRTEVIFEFIL